MCVYERETGKIWVRPVDYQYQFPDLILEVKDAAFEKPSERCSILL